MEGKAVKECYLDCLDNTRSLLSPSYVETSWLGSDHDVSKSPILSASSTTISPVSFFTWDPTCSCDGTTPVSYSPFRFCDYDIGGVFI